MKVVKASVVNPTDDGFICYLSRKEAIAIATLTGNCIGGGSARVTTNHIFNVLNDKGVNTANFMPTIINITGDL